MPVVNGKHYAYTPAGKKAAAKAKAQSQGNRRVKARKKT